MADDQREETLQGSPALLHKHRGGWKQQVKVPHYVITYVAHMSIAIDSRHILETQANSTLQNDNEVMIP